MKKIIAVLDGLKCSDSTISYAIEIAKHSNTHLVGVFLDDFTYTSYKIYDLITKGGVSEDQLKEFEDKDKVTRKNASTAFENDCKNAGIAYSIHHDKAIAGQELLHESIYADLLVIDARETFTHYEEAAPTRFIRELLSDVQCPVLLVPPKYKPIDKIILLYDGAPSSVHAIKMFSYLLPVLKHLPTEVISVKNMEGDLHLPDNRLMKEFMKRHYPDANYTILRGLAETEITSHLKMEKQNPIIVAGAYRRSTVSRWFRQSMADILMSEIKSPLFVAHNK
jgi:hypothetical protein